MSQMGKEIATGGDGDQADPLGPLPMTGRRATMQIGTGDSNSGESTIGDDAHHGASWYHRHRQHTEPVAQQPGVSGLQEFHEEVSTPQNDYTNVLQNIFADGLQFFQPLRMSDFDLADDVKPPGPKIVGGYAVGDVLGEGSFGKVKDAVCQATLQRVAIKIVKLKKNRTLQMKQKKERQMEDVKKEIKIMKALNHPNVIRLLDHFVVPGKEKVYLVLDYCVGSVQQLIDHSPQKKLPEFQAHRYFVELINGVEYIHSRGINHNDIKPGNLLLSLMGQLKISDFGIAAQLDSFNKDGICFCGDGTPVFTAPELISGDNEPDNGGFVCGAPVDMWCCGLTLYNFITGKYPFDMDLAYFSLMQQIKHAPIKMPENFPITNHLSSLLYGLLTKDPKTRFSIQKIRKNYWFKQHHPVRPQQAVPVTAWSNLKSDRGITMINGLQELFQPEIDAQCWGDAQLPTC